MKRKVIVFFICLILLLTSYPQKENNIVEEHDNIVDELFNSRKGDIINLIRNNQEDGEEACGTC